MKQKISAEIAELSDTTPIISVGDENAKFTSLSASLAEIRKLNGINGYILRSATSAIIDLTEQDKIIDYAILTSQISESSSEIAKQFNMEEITSVLVEGKTVKVLCMTVGENKIGVFMEKTATHAPIIKRINS
jgi:predicted regulator of Ras-like GTPase activity (Roadblock/LC7/MglB family)